MNAIRDETTRLALVENAVLNLEKLVEEHDSRLGRVEKFVWALGGAIVMAGAIFGANLSPFIGG